MAGIIKHNLRLCLGIQLFMGLSLIGMLTACSHRDDHDHPDLTTGEALFDHHCAECHGVDGTGLLADQTPANILTQRSRDGIVDYMTKPLNPKRKMPVFATMPIAEAALIAGHLLELKQSYEDIPISKKKPRGLMIAP